MSILTVYSSDPLTSAVILPGLICRSTTEPLRTYVRPRGRRFSVVAVGLQVVAPRLAPERGRDLPALDDDRRNGLALLAALLHLAGRPGRGAGPPARRDEIQNHIAKLRC